MSIDEMRRALFQVYGGAPSWVDYVKRMPESQVVAVFWSMKERHYI